MRLVASFIFVLQLIGASNAVTSDVPGVNGPIPIVPLVEGSKTRPSQFEHPGLWHTHDDLETMRNNVLNGTEPWASTYARFSEDYFSTSTYRMAGPDPVISRGVISNYSGFQNDIRAAYQNAIMWYITKDQAHWNRSTTILDAWGTNLTNIIGTDRSLFVGVEGSILVNAAEIMKFEGGWVEKGDSWSGTTGFSNQIYWLFARQSIIIGQANYGMASIAGLLHFAVYLDDVAMWNYALYSYQNDLCAGISANIDTSTGQSSESGRDQAHVQDGLQWMSMATLVAQNQGYDLFGYEDNLLLKNSEYTAKYNLNETVPYDPSFYRCEVILVDGPWTEISASDRGVGYFGDNNMNPACWDIIYYSALSQGIAAPWTSRAKAQADASVGNNTSPGDPLYWGDLLFAQKAR